MGLHPHQKTFALRTAGAERKGEVPVVTLRDIARLAGVAPSTVSRIINGKADKSASPEVKSRVWQIVRSTGYIPNKAAQQLRTGDALEEKPVISTLFARADGAYEDSYFVELAAYVSQEIMRQGCRVGPQFTLTQAQRGDFCGYVPGRQDGLVILGKTEADCNDFILKFHKRVTYITLNQAVLSRDHIACNGLLAAETALQYLRTNGHRSIAYVGERKNEVRFTGYKDFLEREHLPFVRELVFAVHMSADGGRQAAEAIARAEVRPTAVFCANDATAIGLLRGLAAARVRVPEDISVISIDDIPAAAKAKPELTTVRIPVNEMGGLAVKILLDRIQKGHVAYLNLFVPSRLVVRNSVAQL